MNVILFGATGMVGQGVLREVALATDVTRVLAVARGPLPRTYDKVEEVRVQDPGDLSGIADRIPTLDACLFCLGTSAAGMSEADYRAVTYDLTLRIARQLVAQRPEMTFVYVSGQGTGGSAMWARVKAETERALLDLGFARAFMFRPGLIQPKHGITSRTGWYRATYVVLTPIFPILHAVAPRSFITTDQLGRAMLEVVRHGAPKPILETKDLVTLAEKA